MTAKSGFFLFCLLYSVPYVSGLDMGNRMSPVLLHMMEQLLRSSAFQIDLAVTLVTHFALLGLCYPIHALVFKQMQALPGVRQKMAAFASCALLWVVVYGWNQILFHETRHQFLPAAALKPMVFGASAICFIFLSAGLFRKLMVVRFARPAVMTMVAFVAVSVAGFSAVSTVDARSNQNLMQRNVIVIGIDSLSQRIFEANQDVMPHFQRLYRQSVAYTNAWTPMARTCPAWLSILSGRLPAEHGGVFNLRQADQIDTKGLLSKSLQANGYHTVFGLDERRFCGIDQSFGFDRVVGPEHGAIDFLIQKFNDAPLVNMFLQSGASAYLLPHSRLNVAAHAAYPADEFVKALMPVHPVRGKGLFMVAHFESAHYPYVARDAREISQAENPFLRDHLNALTVVDRQIDQFMNQLREGGYLDNALVIFLSDHGESFGNPMSVRKLDGGSHAVAAYGHGTNIISPEQNHVLLSYVRYMNGRVANKAAVNNDMVSLLGVATLIENFTSRGELSPMSALECVTLETGIRVAALLNYKKMDERAAAEAGAEFYTVDANGRMHIRESRIADLVGQKDVGARCGNIITQYEAATDRWTSFQESEQGLVEVALHAQGHEVASHYKRKLEHSARK